MRFTRSIWTATALLGALGSVSVATAQDHSAQWNIVTDAGGQIAKMSYTNPPTDSGLESMIVIDINKDGSPSGGEVTLKAGSQQEMTPKEALVYWSEFDGPNAEWNSWKSKGLLKTLKAKDDIPAAWYGRETRVTTLMGIHLIGRLIAPTPDGVYALQIDDAPGPVKFTADGIQGLDQPTTNPLS
jgi:hypothetical protein